MVNSEFLNVFGNPTQRNIFGASVFFRNGPNPYNRRDGLLPRPFSKELTEFLDIQKDFFRYINHPEEFHKDDHVVDFREYRDAHQEYLKSLKN